MWSIHWIVGWYQARHRTSPTRLSSRIRWSPFAAWITTILRIHSQCSWRQIGKIKMITQRLKLLRSHCALFLLKSSLTSNRFLHILRCSNCTTTNTLERIDLFFREALVDILSINIEDNQALQASLPIKMGGLGIRSVKDQRYPCLLASLHSVEKQIQALLPNESFVSFQMYTAEIVNGFTENGGVIPEKKHMQSQWDSSICETKRNFW